MITRCLRLFLKFRILEADRDRLRSEVQNKHESYLSAQRLVTSVTRDLRDTQAEVERLEASRAEWTREVERLKHEREMYARDVVFWKERSDSWERRYVAAVTDSQQVRETIADFAAQIGMRRKIFDLNPALPSLPPEQMKAVPRPRVHARALVQQANAEFQKDIREYIKAQADKQPAA